MPGQRGSETRKRSEQILIRLTPDERAIIGQRADERGLSAADFARAELLGRDPTGAPKRRRTPTGADKKLAAVLAELAAIRSELGHYGANLNQLAHNSNLGRRVPRTALEPLTAAVDALGRRLTGGMDGVLAALHGRSENDHQE